MRWFMFKIQYYDHIRQGKKRKVHTVQRRNLHDDMQDLHFEYMQSAGGYEWDCRYILQASSMVMAQFAEHHAGAHRRGALDLCR